MKIIDTNIFSKFLGGELVIDISGDVYTTEDLRNEIAILRSQFSSNWAKLGKVKFIEIEKHPYFDEVRYLSRYKDFINKHTKITSFYGLKGMGDMSIIATVGTILDHPTPTLFDSQEKIEVVTHDSDLKDALIIEFDGRINISDPVHT